MGLFSKKPKPAKESGPVHAVILRYQLSDEDYGTAPERESILALEDRLSTLIETQGLGRHDGHEFGGGEAVIYCYGPDAARLFEAMEAEARAFPARPAHAYLRFGDVADAAAREERIGF